MVSNQVLQNTIEGIRDITHLEICVMDAEGREEASAADDCGEHGHRTPTHVVSDEACEEARA